MFICKHLSSISEGYNFFSMFTQLRKSYILLYYELGCENVL